MAQQDSLPPLEEFRDVAARFPLHGALTGARRHGSGHINDTYAVEFDQAGTPLRYIFQRINHRIFRDVPRLMENIGRVTSHVTAKEASADNRRALTLVTTREGAAFHRTPSGEYWRVYLFIENASTHDAVRRPEQAFQAARAFARFQKTLADLPGPRLHETIPCFHDTSKRLAALRDSAERDPVGRKARALTELEFAFRREDEARRLLDLVAAGRIAERITHNDTKLNNVMLDDASGEGVCVIDLDTVMPGLSLYDFGDLVRFAANTAAEDETDLAKVSVSLPIFEAIVEGFAEGTGDILGAAEWENLAFAGKLMTYEVGVRFLTDYLEGDVYFKTKHPEHNLERARNQLCLVARIEACFGSLEEIVGKHRLGGITA